MSVKRSEKEHEIASNFMGFTEKEKKKDYVNLLLNYFVDEAVIKIDRSFMR